MSDGCDLSEGDTAYLRSTFHQDGSVAFTINERIPNRLEGVPLAYITLSKDRVNTLMSILSKR